MKNHAPFTFHLSPLTFLCLLLLGVTACKHEKRPADVLDANAMADFLTELYQIDGCFAIESEYRFEKASPEILGACDTYLKEHHLTREQVEKSFDYYSRHPEENVAIQQEVVSRLEMLTAQGRAGSQE